MAPTGDRADANLLDLAASVGGEAAPHALNRRFPAMVADLLRAAGARARHSSATIPLAEEGQRGWALSAGVLDDGDAVAQSQKLGPARFLVHGELGSSGRGGMPLSLRVLRREDGGLVLEIDKDFYEEETGDVAMDVARELAELLGVEAGVEALDIARVQGTAVNEALLRLQEGLDGLAALEGQIAGADGARTAALLVAAVEADPFCDVAAARATAVLATWVESEQALSIARELRSLRPDDEAATLLLARLLQRGRLLEEALETLCSFRLPTRKMSAEIVQLHLSLGAIDAAEQAARAALDGEGGEGEEGLLHELHGIALAQADRLDDAREALRQAVTVEPDRERAWANLGRCLHLLGLQGEARDAYDKALSLAPESWEVSRNYAELAVESGDLARALELVQSWVEARPDDPAAVLALAGLLVALDRDDDARLRLEEALERWPDDERLHACLGGILLSLGKSGEAEVHYVRALENSPDDPALLSNVAMVLAARGDLGEAERLAQRAVQLSPTDAVSLRVLAHIRGKN